MRLFYLYLLGLWFLVIAANAIASTKPTSGAWEVLEKCHLVKSPVNDGDSFKVAHGDKTFIIRLYFVDCPETYDTYMDRLNDQARYFSISNSEVIASGKRAKAYTQKFLKDGFTVITRWEDARGSKETRYFGIVRKENQLLSAELVHNGLARIYGMPTQSSWPGGPTPNAYLKQLKQYERHAQQTRAGIWARAQGSAQLSGLDKIEEQAGILQATPSNRALNANNDSGKLILNTASAAELDTLPGIGPALAARIIESRPFAVVDDLAKVPGISMKKVDSFRDLVLVDEPPPPPMTAAFYLADQETYLNTEIAVLVSTVAQSDLTAPDGFRAVHLETANQGGPGGGIPAFIPDEYYDSFINYYQQPGRTFTGLFFQQAENIVLVYRRK